MALGETLGDLITRRKDELGLTFRQLGQRAKAAGATTEPNWNHLTNRPIREFPRIKTIRALAAALEVDEDEVTDAALESIGLSRGQPGTAIRPGERWIMVSAGGPGVGLDDPAFWVWLADNIPLESYRDLREMFLRANGNRATNEPQAKEK